VNFRLFAIVFPEVNRPHEREPMPHHQKGLDLGTGLVIRAAVPLSVLNRPLRPRDQTSPLMLRNAASDHPQCRGSALTQIGTGRRRAAFGIDARA
jgi:hypothetical protein